MATLAVKRGFSVEGIGEPGGTRSKSTTTAGEPANESDSGVLRQQL